MTGDVSCILPYHKAPWRLTMIIIIYSGLPILLLFRTSAVTSDVTFWNTKISKELNSLLILAAKNLSLPTLHEYLQ